MNETRIRDTKNIVTVIHADPYKNETVEEIIEKCRQKYFSEACDKFRDFGRDR
jgi:hypothetical protein